MRILLWAPFGAGTHFWGPGTSAYRLYKHLDRSQHSVTLVHASSEQQKFPDVYENQIKLPTIKGTGAVGKILYFLKAYLWIRKNYHNYDVVHGITAFEYTFRPAIQFEKLGIPVFIKITGNYGGFGQNNFFSKILGLSHSRQRNASKISGYIALSDAITSNLLKYKIPNEKIFKLPNGVDINRFIPINIEERSNQESNLALGRKFRIIYLGGITENKRVFEMVKATQLLLESSKDCQLLIVGPDRSNGQEIEKIASFINLNNLSEDIKHIDKIDNPEKYLQISDVFVLNSRQEGMSNALLEAMSCGLSCIVTPISGSTDLITDNYSGLYTDGSVENLSQLLKTLYLDRSLCQTLSMNARKIIEDNYSSKQIMNKHIQLFSNKLNDK